MCAIPLAEVEPVVDLSTKGEIPAVEEHEHVMTEEGSMDASHAGGITCPGCQTLNEAGWAFCQHCGGKLPSVAAGPAAVAKPSVTDQPTIISTNPPPPASAEPPRREAPPVSAAPPSLAPPAVATPPRPIQPEPAPHIGLPTVAEQPAIQSPPPAVPLGLQTVVDQAAQRHTPGTEQVQSAPPVAGGMAPVSCLKCNHVNPPGAAFCSACGTPMAVPQTVVMSSVPAPARGRLHLVMEGGQQGETYELKDETVVGRVSGDITFPHDGFMSGRHSRVVRRGGSFFLTDEGSRNGTFIRIKGEVELQSGDLVLIGKQLFRFEV